MASFLAASIGLMASLVASGQQLTVEEKRALESISPGIAYLQAAGRTSGVAVRIANSGLYLAHRSAVFGDIVFAKVSTGQVINLKAVSSDDMTQLVLLQSQDVVPNAQTIGLPSFMVQENAMKRATPKTSVALVGIGAGGPFRAELSGADRLGIMGQNRRVTLLSEIRFEQPSANVTGALIFNLEGKLVGVLGATVLDEPVAQKVADAGLAGAGGSGAPLAANAFRPGTAGGFGPGQLNVGYSIAPAVMDRVIAGFTSPARRVLHPALGVQIKAAEGSAGAQIVVVNAGSPADKAGLKVGDIIEALDDAPISDQLSYSRVLLSKQVGSTVQLRIRRGEKTMTISAVVGS